MKSAKSNALLYFWGVLYVLISAYCVWLDVAYFALASVGLLVIYFAIYNTDKVFLALALFTPLSINIEEYTDSFGLFLPTEPILFGLMIMLIFMRKRGGRSFQNTFTKTRLLLQQEYMLYG